MSKFEEILSLVESAGEWAHGGQPEDVATEWMETNMSLSEIEEWLYAGCFRAEAAFALDNAGLSPDQCSQRRDGMSFAYLVSNFDLSVEKVKYIVENAVA